jgi:uncharacterized protein (DUF433 family)
LTDLSISSIIIIIFLFGGFKMVSLERIELNPRVCDGKPVIKGTRIPVSVLLEQIAQGETWEEILKGFPELSKEDIRAALLYASASLAGRPEGQEDGKI